MVGLRADRPVDGHHVDDRTARAQRVGQDLARLERPRDEHAAPCAHAKLPERLDEPLGAEVCGNEVGRRCRARSGTAAVALAHDGDLDTPAHHAQGVHAIGCEPVEEARTALAEVSTTQS